MDFGFGVDRPIQEIDHVVGIVFVAVGEDDVIA
jgi:hypothetical protein